jgi:hypothetical protein
MIPTRIKKTVTLRCSGFQSITGYCRILVTKPYPVLDHFNLRNVVRDLYNRQKPAVSLSPSDTAVGRREDSLDEVLILRLSYFLL